MNILIKSATIIDPASGQNIKKQPQDILIENGHIVKIAPSIETKKSVTVVALENLHVSPGWFDSSVCFGEPGYEERETLANGLKTAAMSGYTAVAVNPNTKPVLDTNTDISFIKTRAKGEAVNLIPIGALTVKSEGNDLAELYDMKNAGAAAFCDYQKAVTNPNLLKIALQYAQDFDGLICSFPQENKIAGKGVVNEGVNATHLGLKGIPSLAEDLQVKRDLSILEYTGGKLHIPTISTEASVNAIKDAKEKGLDVSCSASLTHLFFNDEVLEAFDSNFKLLPPLRTKKEVEALLDAVKDGKIDMVTTDHNPLDIEHKNVEFDRASYGSIGLESAFGALNSLVGIELAIKLLTNGKKRFGVEISMIEEGQKADLTLFNPDVSYTFEKSHILSSSKNSAFLGTNLKGKAYGIIANNQLILNS